MISRTAPSCLILTCSVIFSNCLLPLGHLAERLTPLSSHGFHRYRVSKRGGRGSIPQRPP
jgi:hypothetical protein